MEASPLKMEDLELFSFGRPVASLSGALSLELFKNGAIDIFENDTHYRIEWIWPHVDGIEIKLDVSGSARLRQFVNGNWQKADKSFFDFHIRPTALMQAFHGTDRKLVFVAFAENGPDGIVRRCVLYPGGRIPRRGDQQVIGWKDALNPILSHGEAPALIH